MLPDADLPNGSLEAGRGRLSFPPQSAAKSLLPRAPALMVPIRSLGTNHRERIAAHLLSLDPNDRYLRFGYIAHDEQIQRYVYGLDFERDEIFGIYNRRLHLIAMAHLAYADVASCESCAEFGVSVLSSSRGRGYGARLFERAAMHAVNDGIRHMLVHALSENTAMLTIARKAGAQVVRKGSDSEAYLELPASTIDSRLAEMVEEAVAQTDYRMKVQVKRFWRFLAGVKAIRRG
jgi:GNAT superfamily N-acetyltransferase